MPGSLSVRVSASCNSLGQGELTVALLNYASGETVTVEIDIIGGGYSVEFPTVSSPHVITGVANGIYIVSVTGSVSGSGQVFFGASQTASLDGEIEVDCTPAPPPPSCDLEITSVTTVQATGGLNNGRATINATGTGTIEYSLNGENWQASPIFNSLAVNVYTAYIRKQSQLSCGDQSAFEVTASPVLGCTNPDADNYNPAATQDNGSCMYLSKFYACGGVLPNPVSIAVSLPVSNGGSAKANHYVKLNIYKTGTTTPFATAIQSLRNGKANIDISKYLQTQFNNAYQEPTTQVIYRDANQSFGFFISIIEHYNGTVQPEVLKKQPARVAVNAALPEYADTIGPYLIKGLDAVPEEESGDLDPEL